MFQVNLFYTLYCFCHYKLPKLFKMNETLSEGLHPLLTVLSSLMVCLGHGLGCPVGVRTKPHRKKPYTDKTPQDKTPLDTTPPTTGQNLTSFIMYEWIPHNFLMQYYINNIGKTALYTFLSDSDLQLFCL